MKRFMMVLGSLVIGAVLAYCGDPAGPDGPTGPVLFGLISGDGQIAVAGADSLIEPVVGQAYRDASGNVAFRFGPTPLYAQTDFGTGVPNIPTCAAPVGDDGLIAYVQCAQTDSAGFVRYWFRPDTIATDSACAEIRAIVQGQPEVLATTCATVDPGPVELNRFTKFRVAQHGYSPLTLATTLLQDQYLNDVPYYIVADSVVSVGGGRTLTASGAGVATVSVYRTSDSTFISNATVTVTDALYISVGNGT